jgi:hypothetical protein
MVVEIDHDVCGYKPNNAGRHQKLEEVGNASPLESPGAHLANTFISAQWN